MTSTEPTERQDLRRVVAKLGADYGHDYFVRCAREGRHVEDLWAELSALGLAGVNLGTQYGGAGGGLYDLMIVGEELGAAGVPLMTLVVSPALCGPLLERYGSDELKDRWLRGVATGEHRLAFAITEPDAGSNSHNLRTAAERHSGGWRLRGEKYFISGVDDAAAVVTVARTGTDAATGRARLSVFVVERDRPGLMVRPLPTQVLAAERQFTVVYDDVVIPEGNLIGEEGAGLRQLFTGLNPERVMSAAICTGIGRYALAKAASYARDRVVWDQPIGAHQGIAHPLARAHIGIECARVMTQRAADLFDAGLDAGAEANMAKFAAAEAAQAALDAAIQTHGGNGLADEFGLADLWGLTRLYGIAPVSREMVLNYVGQHLLGLPRSYR